MIYKPLITGIFLFLMIVMINGHARIKSPKPLAAAPESPAGNHYNEPLRPDGSEFPCKGLHKRADVNKTPTEVWKAGAITRFEILGHGTTSGFGNLAAHSGGSCQASLSFDNGETWKVLHSYEGGCPRDVEFESNLAGQDQVFFFRVPAETRPGPVLFSWTWVAVTGNRNEFYQNCASVMITGTGNSTLDHLPDMFVGDMTIPGQIEADECRSTVNKALAYPNPGPSLTITEVENIEFQEPTSGRCVSRASLNQTVFYPATTTTTTTRSTMTTTAITTTATITATTTKATTPASTTTGSMFTQTTTGASLFTTTTATSGQCSTSFPSSFQIMVDNKPRPCMCFCDL